jgi:hypothetical protein
MGVPGRKEAVFFEKKHQKTFNRAARLLGLGILIACFWLAGGGEPRLPVDDRTEGDA